MREVLQDAVSKSPLSIVEIAEKSGVSRKALYSLLKGDADPRLSTIEALAHTLGLGIVVAPKAVEQLQLHRPVLRQASEHSKIRRLLTAHEEKARKD
ncbi:helix-turn-helix domain-containing protein (plasmid) [Diaphorobacter sp. HDW4B]|uniref:helix-turn-helix domain-containing transcriptional regulator n=1 Tax=Diaphorobacter sp. HDW4B TaxID=2714925 RepID=UPI00140B5901|nr:helix-turn-helix domain-containing protein [Diaphorobacter sp. HDW4B]QIL74134.1 helix-turn-helix domain-containing protein [Diaphorobacter sp. HDW4B]